MELVNLVNKKLYLYLVLLIFNLFVKGQDVSNYDTLRSLCYGPIFTYCEEMPFLKNGVPFFEDTLSKYLRNQNEFPKPGKISLQLAILRSGEVKYVSVRSGETDKIMGLVIAIKKLSDQWVPGRQNGRIVCCYRKIDIDFLVDRIQINLPDKIPLIR